MSANQKGKPEIKDPIKIYRFEQTVPVPAYSIAIFAGNYEEVESQSTRISIVAEP